MLKFEQGLKLNLSTRLLRTIYWGFLLAAQWLIGLPGTDPHCTHRSTRSQSAKRPLQCCMPSSHLPWSRSKTPKSLRLVLGERRCKAWYHYLTCCTAITTFCMLLRRLVWMLAVVIRNLVMMLIRLHTGCNLLPSCKRMLSLLQMWFTYRDIVSQHVEWHVDLDSR